MAARQVVVISKDGTVGVGRDIQNVQWLARDAGLRVAASVSIPDDANIDNYLSVASAAAEAGPVLRCVRGFTERAHPAVAKVFDELWKTRNLVRGKRDRRNEPPAVAVRLDPGPAPGFHDTTAAVSPSLETAARVLDWLAGGHATISRADETTLRAAGLRPGGFRVQRRDADAVECPVAPGLFADFDGGVVGGAPPVYVSVAPTRTEAERDIRRAAACAAFRGTPNARVCVFVGGSHLRRVFCGTVPSVGVRDISQKGTTLYRWRYDPKARGLFVVPLGLGDNPLNPDPTGPDPAGPGPDPGPRREWVPSVYSTGLGPAFFYKCGSGSIPTNTLAVGTTPAGQGSLAGRRPVRLDGTRLAKLRP